MASTIPTPTGLSRLQNILSHLEPKSLDVTERTNQQLSIVHGPTEPELVYMTLGELMTLQSLQFYDHECLICPWSGARWTYGFLEHESNRLARGLLSLGIEKADRIGVMAGNCEQYVALFFAAAKVGAILVVINNTYTTSELIFALQHTECKLLFAVPAVGPQTLEESLNILDQNKTSLEMLPSLEATVMLRGRYKEFITYEDVMEKGNAVPLHALGKREDELSPNDVCNLQFTSGSTGNPKAAMLTHHNIVNNSRFIGDRMDLTFNDVLCCPPPLFHCFGLVLGLLAVITHGAKIVYPGEVFEPSKVLQAISDEQCTALHGVPTMFEAILNIPRPAGFDCANLRTGIIAGAPVPRPLMERLFSELNMIEFTSSYGLTEASPTCFNAFTTDSIHRRLTTVGKILPHARGKIIDPADGSTLPIGSRGELCISGYQIFRGYWKNESKTDEVLLRDSDGTLWLRTGDEAIFDAHDYCSITGRFKDIIIRGGENIYPLEIEERLTAHKAITKATVVGMPDKHYGEVVAAFLTLSQGATRPTDRDVRQWTQRSLGRHKAPNYVFVFGEDEGLPSHVPQTGSGKVQKQVLRELGRAVLDRKGVLKSA